MELLELIITWTFISGICLKNKSIGIYKIILKNFNFFVWSQSKFNLNSVENSIKYK